ncbi:unnamed protein product [Leptidea sinapis]|uniref:Uncharacterized protein n=1 Tax=Leptidea sinapis TaxID=189913 RepID=A0A5E4PMR8_9NEOP|nr:unnamed protein product [Leptidea sinapis]
MIDFPQCHYMVSNNCNHLRHDYEELNYYNELLNTQHFKFHARRRRRRGIVNGVGYLANELFGILDSRFAEQYTQDIEIIKSNEKHLAKLWKNQTSVFETEFNVLKNLQTTVDKQHKFINKKLNEFEESTNTLQLDIQNFSHVQDFLLTSVIDDSLLRSLKRLQDTLLDTITDIYHGQISLHIRVLSPAQLKGQLQIMYGLIPSELTLPVTNIDTNLHTIYKLLRVKTRVTQKYVIYEVKFPLVSTDIYQLYKTLPVPHQINKEMIAIIPVTEFVAINLRKNLYFSVTMTELNDCLHQERIYLCPLLKPVINIENDKSFCEINPETQMCRLNRNTCSNSLCGVTAWICRRGRCCRGRGTAPARPSAKLQVSSEPVISDIVKTRKQSTADRQLSVTELPNISDSDRLPNFANRWPRVNRSSVLYEDTLV